MLGPRHELCDAALGELQAIGERGHVVCSVRSGAPLICRRSRYHAGVIPQSRATTSVWCWNRRSATRNSATRAASSAVGGGGACLVATGRRS